MNLPETAGYREYSPEELAQFFSSYIQDALAERDEDIRDLRGQLETSERENELLRERIEKLSVSHVGGAVDA